MLQFQFTLRDARRMAIVLLLFEIVLAAVFIGDLAMGKPSYSIHSLFDMDGEACIPAWFSSMQLLLTGLVLLLASRAPAGPRQPSPYFLGLLAACFIFLSADEAGMIHERLRGLMQRVAAAMPQVNGHGAWISIYVCFGLGLLLVTWKELLFVLKNYRRESLLGIAGFGVMCLGAVGLEVISYGYLRDGSTPLLYGIEVALEEFLEMSGGSIVLYAVTRFCIQRLQAPVIEFMPAASRALPVSAVADEGSVPPEIIPVASGIENDEMTQTTRLSR